MHGDIIRALINHYRYTSYLEIGCGDGQHFASVPVADKTCVDPDTTTRATHHLTSDDFFKQALRRYDLIFVDGLHEHEQVFRDIRNAIIHLSDGGTIVVHDCNPTSEEMQTVPRHTKVWTGDGWKAWIKIRTSVLQQPPPDCLAMFVLDTDFGCGIIQVHRSVNYYHDVPIPESYEEFDKHRKECLTLLPYVSDWIFRYGVPIPCFNLTADGTVRLPF